MLIQQDSHFLRIDDAEGLEDEVEKQMIMAVGVVGMIEEEIILDKEVFVLLQRRRISRLCW